jgi:hypothetical protein
MLVFVCACLSALAPSAPKANMTRSFDAAHISHLPVVSSGGAVQVRGIQTTQARLAATPTLGGASCTLQTDVGEGVLTVKVGDPNAAPCQIDLDITLPRRLAIDIHTEVGNGFVSGMQGAVHIALGRGNAVLGGHISELTAQLEAGSLSAQGLVGDAQVILKAGNAQLWYTADAKATVTLEVERGNVTIGSDAPSIAAQLNLETGKLQASVPQAADAPLHVIGHVAHGDVIVRPGRGH